MQLIRTTHKTGKPPLLSTDGWMQDVFQCRLFCGAIKDQFTKVFSVKRAVNFQYFSSEVFDNATQGGLARCYQRPGKLIGINDRNTEFRKFIGDDALAAGNATGEGDGW